MTDIVAVTADTLGGDPIGAFSRWLEEAGRQEGVLYPNACCLSTVGEDGDPQGRIVLLKGVDQGGFVFFTNYRSVKGRALAERPAAALTFYWDALARQVRVRGSVVRVTPEESDAYFRTRPRGSQLGAWASRQSEVLPDRDLLDARYLEAESRCEGLDVARPAHWGGFRVLPDAIEFWQGRPDRLHDRILFEREADAWRTVRLSP